MLKFSYYNLICKQIVMVLMKSIAIKVLNKSHICFFKSFAGVAIYDLFFHIFVINSTQTGNIAL